MFCSNCGKPIETGKQACSECGQPAAPPMAAESTRGQGLAIASLVLAIVGFSLAAIVTGVISLMEKRPGRPLAIAGVLISAFQSILGALLAVLITSFAILGVTIAALEEHRETKAASAWNEEWDDHDVDRDWDEPEMNVDTSFAAMVPEFTERNEAEIAELEDRTNLLAEEFRDDEEASSTILVARYHLNRAKRGLRELNLNPDDAIFEAMVDIETHIASAAAELDKLSPEPDDS